MPSYDTLNEATLGPLWPLRDEAGIPIVGELAVRNNVGVLIGTRIFGSRDPITLDPYLQEDWEVRPRGS